MLDLFSACYSNVLSFCSLVICCNLRNRCTTQCNYHFICLVFSGSALWTGLSWGRERFFCWAQLGVSSAGPAGITHVAGVGLNWDLSHMSGSVTWCWLSSQGLSSARRWEPGPLHPPQCSRTMTAEAAKASWGQSSEHLQHHFVILLVKASQKAGLDLEGGEGNFTAWCGEWQSITVKRHEYRP